MIKEKLEKLIYKCGILTDRIESIEYHAELNYRELTHEEEQVIEELKQELNELNEIRREVLAEIILKERKTYDKNPTSRQRKGERTLFLTRQQHEIHRCGH